MLGMCHENFWKQQKQKQLQHTSAQEVWACVFFVQVEEQNWPRKGTTPDVYFKFETPLAIGDPTLGANFWGFSLEKLSLGINARFVDPGLAMKKGKVWMLDPDATFKPPGKVKQSFSAAKPVQLVESVGTLESLDGLNLKSWGINKLGYEYAWCSECRMFHFYPFLMFKFFKEEPFARCVFSWSQAHSCAQVEHCDQVKDPKEVKEKWPNPNKPSWWTASSFCIAKQCRHATVHGLWEHLLEGTPTTSHLETSWEGPRKEARWDTNSDLS